MNVQLQFAESNGNSGGDFEFKKDTSLADIDALIAFCKRHGNEVWLGDLDWPVEFDRVVMLVDQNIVRVELNFA